MSCAYEEDLTAHVDGELEPLRAKQVEQHLGTCAECRATLSLLKRTVALVQAMPAFEPSASLRRAVLHRIDEPPSLQDRLRAALSPAVVMPAFGLAAAVFIAVASSGGRPGRGAEVEASQLELAANLEVVSDIDVVGLDSPEDIDVVQHLQELEAQP